MSTQSRFKAASVSTISVLFAICIQSQAQQPPGADVAIWKLIPKAPSAREAKVRQNGKVNAESLGDGQIARLAFYSLPNPSSGCDNCRASYFDAETREGITLWRHPVMLPGCMDLASSQFYDPTGVHRLFKEGPPVIVSFAVMGAAAGGILNIYRWNAKTARFEDISGDWNEVEEVDGVRFEDLDGDGNREIIILHTAMASFRTYGPKSVYRWNGKRYEREGTLSPSKTDQ